MISFISFIIAPEDCQQILAPQPQPPPATQLDEIDQQIVAEFRRHGRYGARIWSVLNLMAKDAAPENRDDLRRIKLELEDRLRGLLRAGVLFLFNRRYVTSCKIQRERTVRRKRRFDAGSAVKPASESASTPSINQFSLNWLGQTGALPTSSLAPQKTKSAPDPAQAAEAARLLAKLPRQEKRTRTGWLHGKHCWRGQPIRFADGRRAFLWGCTRRKVVWSLAADELLFSVARAGIDWGVLAESELTREKNVAAVTLGGLKAGLREQKSEAKASAARINGARPCRPGRRRGRPKKIKTPR